MCAALCVNAVRGGVYNLIMYAMSEAHRQRLRRNRVALLRNICLGEELWGILLENSTLTDDMCNSIKVRLQHTTV